MSNYSDLYVWQSYKQPSLCNRKTPDLAGKDMNSFEMPTPRYLPATEASVL